MEFAPWIRDRVWRANSWTDELARLRQGLAAEPRTARTIERTVELAWAMEACDPDRGRALALYLEAWRGGHTGARERATVLASELRAHLTVAELALHAGDPMSAGAAFLDAGFPELAVDPLQQFVDARPPGASATTENVRLEGVRALLALARHQRFDADKEITDALARAGHATGRAAVAAYVHAARVARVADLNARIPAIIGAAARACPDDPTIVALVETRLLETNNGDEILAHYRARFERAASRPEYVERVRGAGVELIARNLQPGLGLRLLRMSLESAYAAQVPEVTSHIAAWELIRTHAQAQQSTLDLVPLIVQAMASPLSEDVAVYLARLGLEIAWHDASDTLAAQPYAAMLLDFVPDHPLAVAFVAEVSPAVAPITPAPAPQTQPPTPKPTSRMPVIDQGEVKRSVAPPLATPKPQGVTGRLALLTPPPPRATSLKRDTSPFPISRPPSRPTAARAPRKVVPVDAVIELPNGSFFSTVLRDLSSSGAFIVTKRKLEIDMVVALEMKIPKPGKVAETSHRTNARIARLTDVGCGLAFVDASPELVALLRAITE